MREELGFEHMSQRPTGDGHTIDYGIIDGTSRIFFIKPGKGGSCFGNENKYSRIAQNINRDFGDSVICSSNPEKSKDVIQPDIDFLASYYVDRTMTDVELYFMGYSDGARQGLRLATVEPRIRKLLLINMPLMIQFHQTKDLLARLRDREIIFVYGDRDPSFSYLPFLKISADFCKFRTVANADHRFSGLEETFLQLPQLLYRY